MKWDVQEFSSRPLAFLLLCPACVDLWKQSTFLLPLTLRGASFHHITAIQHINHPLFLHKQEPASSFWSQKSQNPPPVSFLCNPLNSSLAAINLPWSKLNIFSGNLKEILRKSMESSVGSVPALSCHRRATDSGVSEAVPENWRPGSENQESKVFLRQPYITWCNKRLENSDAITKAPAEWVTPDLMNPAGRQEFRSSAPGLLADVWGKQWRFTLARKCWMLLLISNSCQGWNAS